MTTGTEQFFDAWKKQVESSVHIMDTVVKASAKMRSAQLSAANETHDRAQALEKCLADAKSAQELWNAQWNWALASCERSADYWRKLFEAMNEANGELAHCVQAGIQSAVPSETGGEMPPAGFAAVDNVYREMLKTSQQLLQYTASAFDASAKPAAPAGADGNQAKKAA